MKFCPPELWETLVRADETATFFQTPAWHRIAARHFQAESVSLLFEFPDGPACLPLLRDRRWGRWRYFSPFGTYTAVVCPRALSPDEIAVIERQLAKLNIQLASSPFTHNEVHVGRCLPHHVHIISLAPDPDAFSRWERDARRRSRGAAAAGIHVREARQDTDWKAYQSLYRDSLDRWGDKATSVYPPALFRDLRESLGGTSAMRLWLAEDSAGVPGAGFIAFYHNRHAVLWHAAANAAFFRQGAVQLLYHDILKHAANNGFTCLDLLGSAGLAGVEAFKESIGAKRVEFASFLNRAGVIGRLAEWRERITPGRPARA